MGFRWYKVVRGEMELGMGGSIMWWTRGVLDDGGSGDVVRNACLSIFQYIVGYATRVDGYDD